LPPVLITAIFIIAFIKNKTPLTSGTLIS